MASRKYVRDSAGRFAGGKGGAGGTFVTTGKAGGFANSAFRSRVAQGSASSGRGTANRLAKGTIKRAASSNLAKAAGRGLAGAAMSAATVGVVGAIAGARSNRSVNKGLSLVNKNATLYGQNASSVSSVIRRSRGRI